MDLLAGTQAMGHCHEQYIDEGGEVPHWHEWKHKNVKWAAGSKDYCAGLKFKTISLNY